jgi:hypothetical protein
MVAQHQDSTFSETATVPSHRAMLPLLLVGAVIVMLIGTALGLWAHYGTAVFYEMIVAGIAACF